MTGNVIRTVLSGVGHWHTPLYLEPLLEEPGVEIVGVCDPDEQVAARLAGRLGCAFATGLEDLLERVRCDFAFVLGRHADMAADVELLIGRGIPLVVEKPAGIGAAEVAQLAATAEAAGVFVAVPLVFRTSGYFSAIREIAADEEILYAGFKFVAGLPSRYHDAGCGWMFDRTLAGGGVLTNLGVHFVDLFQLLNPGSAVSVTSANFARLHGNGDVEDYCALTLRGGPGVALIESGYLYPAPGGVFDMHYSVRTERHYFVATGPGSFYVKDIDGNRRELPGTTTNIPIYPEFVADVVRRLRAGEPPVADLSDMATVLRVVDDAYALSDRPAAAGDRRQDQALD